MHTKNLYKLTGEILIRGLGKAWGGGGSLKEGEIEYCVMERQQEMRTGDLNREWKRKVIEEYEEEEATQEAIRRKTKQI